MTEHWQEAKDIFDPNYLNYLIASVGATFGVNAKYPKSADRVYVNVEHGAVAPQGYGAKRAIYLALNPDSTGVDFESDAANDWRPDWKYGHNSVICLDIDEATGEIQRVYAPAGHEPRDLFLPLLDMGVFGVRGAPVLPFAR